MIRSDMEIVILADSQEKGDIALAKMEKRFLNSVMQGKLIFRVKVIGSKSNDSIPESDDTNGWIDKPSEGDEPWK